MRTVGETLLLAPTDLSAFLSCRHRTGLDLAAARGEIVAPFGVDPFSASLRRLGEEHERRHVESLRSRGLCVIDLGDADDRETKTAQAMRDGVEVIVQAGLSNGRWHGVADVLRRVEQPSELGRWSYEVHDTKLARATRGGTVLQLSAYSDLVAQIQGRCPEFLHVVAPGRDGREFQVTSLRVSDYAAYHRMVRGALERLGAGGGVRDMSLERAMRCAPAERRSSVPRRTLRALAASGAHCARVSHARRCSRDVGTDRIQTITWVARDFRAHRSSGESAASAADTGYTSGRADSCEGGGGAMSVAGTVAWRRLPRPRGRPVRT